MQVVSFITFNQTYCLLDIHNYGQYYGNPINSSSVPIEFFYDLWYNIASVFKENPYVLFGLMNEPEGFATSETVVLFQNYGIQGRTSHGELQSHIRIGIRDAGANQLITVAGNDWTGAHDWVPDNSGVMMQIRDPLNNFIYEMHQYFDYDYSGTHPCNTQFNTTAIMQPATNWLRKNNRYVLFILFL